MDAPSLDSLRQEIDAIDSELARPDPAPREPWSSASPRPSRRAAWRCGRAARRRSCASGSRRSTRTVPARRRLSHVARDDERLHPDPDARTSRSRSAAPTTSPATGTSRATTSAARSPSSPTTRRPGVLAAVRARPHDHRRRAGADRGRFRAMVAACWPARTRPCRTSSRACPSWSCPMRARAASRPSCWPASTPSRAARIARSSRSRRRAASAATASPRALAKAGLPAFTSALDQVAGGVHHYLVELPGVIVDERSAPARARSRIGVSRTVASRPSAPMPCRSTRKPDLNFQGDRA